MTDKFRVGITSDFLNAEGKVGIGDIGLGLLDADPLIEYEFFTPKQPEVTPDQIQRYDGIIAMGGRYTRATFVGIERLTVLGRFGVGYDNVDTQACTDANVMLFITPEGVRRPVASSIIGLILALSLRMFPRHEYTRRGNAAQVRQMIGTGLVGRTLASVGCGNIAREMFRLAAPFEMRHLASDPYVRSEDVAALGVKLVDLDTLLGEADFLCINCPLQPSTYKLIGAKQFALMKPTAYLINTARGGIVDTDALVQALRDGRLAGAGLDVTDPEPLPPDHELFTFENVIVTSHRLAWTDQLVSSLGHTDMQGMIKVAHGEVPPHVVNTEVLQKEGLRRKLERYRQRAKGS